VSVDTGHGAVLGTAPDLVTDPTARGEVLVGHRLFLSCVSRTTGGGLTSRRCRRWGPPPRRGCCPPGSRRYRRPHRTAHAASGRTSTAPSTVCGSRLGRRPTP